MSAKRPKINKSKGYTERPDADCIRRMLDKCQIPKARIRGNGKCWIWTGYKDGYGYGQGYFGKEMGIQWVHRMSYLIFNGPLEAGCQIDHTCHEPSCICPDHLEQKTVAGNLASRRRKVRVGKDIVPPDLSADDSIPI